MLLSHQKPHLNPARNKLHRNFLNASLHQNPMIHQPIPHPKKQLQQSPIRQICLEDNSPLISNHNPKPPLVQRNPNRHKRSQSSTHIENRKLSREIVDMCCENNKLVFKILEKTESIAKITQDVVKVLQRKNEGLNDINTAYRNSILVARESFGTRKPRQSLDTDKGNQGRGTMDSIRHRLQSVRKELKQVEQPRARMSWHRFETPR